MRIALVLLFALTLTLSAQSSKDYMELVKTNLSAGKKNLIVENLEFSEAESEKFWPLYESFEAETNKLFEEKVKLLQDYAENYAELSDAKADELMTRNLAIQEQEAKLDAEYFIKFKQILPSKKAAKFMQIMNQIEVLIRFQIAAQVPLIGGHEAMEAPASTEEKESRDM
jgi:hypothetical protein